MLNLAVVASLKISYAALIAAGRQQIDKGT
jgi:hypothetical protein